MAEDPSLEYYQYPNAHIGHLTGEQETQLNEFKRLVKQESTYVPPTPGGPGGASHDDETLLRYLRARKFNPTEALEQFKNTEKWRRKNELEKLYDTIDVDVYEQTRGLYPQWTGRRDKRGIPVYVYEVAHLNQKTMTAYEKSLSSDTSVDVSNNSLKMLRLFTLYENLTRFVMPLCTAVPDRDFPETPISQSNNIVDISKVGLKQFWNLKQHMQDASTLATAHYPETLDRIFIIGAPSFFPTVWGWIKKWFDPITVSKIFILSQDTMASTLEEYIDSENIPKKYGGKLDYEYGMLPNIEPAIDKILDWEHPETALGKKTFPTGPIKWEKSQSGKLSAVAVGTETGAPRNRIVASMASAEPKVKSARLGVMPPSLYRTTTGASTHPRDVPDVDFYIEDNMPLSDDASTDMQSERSSPFQGGYTTIDVNNRTIGGGIMASSATTDRSTVDPATAPIVASEHTTATTVISPPTASAGGTASTGSTVAASEYTTTSTVVAPSVVSDQTTITSGTTAIDPLISSSYASSDLSASSAPLASSPHHVPVAGDYHRTGTGIGTGEGDDSSSITSQSVKKVGSVYRTALDKATKAMESVGIVGSGERRTSSPTSFKDAGSSPSAPASTSSSMHKVSVDEQRRASPGSNKVSLDNGTAGDDVGGKKMDKAALEEALRNKYASG